ncbi:MAG TPA: hypothetical protein VM432_12525, partial [Bdellovibrionales bacterium]|nr:hypothetical protein [Bdellovibrionales bacterium]
ETRIKPRIKITEEKNWFSFGGHEIGLASHALGFLNEARRLTDESLGLIPNVRIGSLPGQAFSLGCRTYHKISPHPSSDLPASSTERFSISYDRCLDGADRVTRVDLTGSEVFAITYPNPFPKQGEGRDLDFPSTIQIESLGVNYKARLAGFGTSDSIEVDRTYSYRADLVWDDGQYLYYEGVMKMTEDFRSVIDGKGRKNRLKTRLQSIEFVIDREKRKTVAISPVDITVNAEEDAYKFTTADEIELPSNVCDWPQAEFHVQAADSVDAFNVNLEAGVISIGEKKSKEMKSCVFDQLTKSYVPSSALAIQMLYYQLND